MKLFTIAEAAERLNITPRQVTALVRRGRIPWVNVSLTTTGNKPRKRIAEADLNAFIEQRRVVQETARRTYRKHRSEP